MVLALLNLESEINSLVVSNLLLSSFWFVLESNTLLVLYESEIYSALLSIYDESVIESSDCSKCLTFLDQVKLEFEIIV